MVVAIGGRNESPVLACETLKPLVDAGTDEGLWADDNPFHRVATLYMRDPTDAPPGRTRISIAVIPLEPSGSMPGWVVSRVSGALAAPVSLSIPARQWRGKALGADCAVMCGVRYPDSRPRWVGDPYNTAETATAMWGAGVALGSVPADPSLFGFYLLAGQSAPHTHDMGLLAFTVPHGFDWMRALLA